MNAIDADTHQTHFNYFIAPSTYGGPPVTAMHLPSLEILTPLDPPAHVPGPLSVPYSMSQVGTPEKYGPHRVLHENIFYNGE